MPNNFQVFNPGGANMLDDEAYTNSAYRQGGAIAGIAPSADHNKLFYQTSLMTAVIGQYISNKGETASDGNFDELLAALTAALAPPPSVPTGLGCDYWIGGSPPSGWIYAYGTIGNALSGATNRANDDTQALFTALWNASVNTALPVYSSGGILVTRGVSALADWLANRRLSVPDKRGRVTIGLENMGGVSAGRVTAASKDGANASVFAGTGGEEVHLMTLAELVKHKHFVGRTADAGTGSTRFSVQAGSNVETTEAGQSQPFNVMQPWISCPYIIKL